MWRPENWENPYNPSKWQINAVSHIVSNESRNAMSAAELMGRDKGYEAGADAMLRAVIHLMEDETHDYEEIAYPMVIQILRGEQS